MHKDIASKQAILAITEDIAHHLLNIDIKEVEFVDKELIPFSKSNNTKALILVRFSMLKKSRIAISILGFLSTLKQTIISTF